MPDITGLAYVLIAIVLFLAFGNLIASFLISRRLKSGADLSNIKDEFEIRKNIFTIIAGVSLVTGAVFSFYEFGLKTRAEDRQVLYGALGQLIEIDDKHPDISAAALLQLDRLGASSENERPALVQIVSAYLNERAEIPVKAHSDGRIARADIQMAAYVLSSLLATDPALGRLVQLNSVDLRHVRLDRASFFGVEFIGVDLRGAELSNADFSNSDLTGSVFTDANLSNARFTNAILDQAEFEGATVDNVDFCHAESRVKTTLTNFQSSRGAACITPRN